MRTAVCDLAAEDGLEALDDLVDDQLVTAASTLLQIEQKLIRTSIICGIRPVCLETTTGLTSNEGGGRDFRDRPLLGT